MNFQLKKACADLVKLEYDMRSGTTDQRVLRESRFIEQVETLLLTLTYKGLSDSAAHPEIRTGPRSYQPVANKSLFSTVSYAAVISTTP